MTMRITAAICAAALWILASPIAAHAQMPSLATGWADFKDSPEACRNKAEKMLRQLKLRRIERVASESVFADSPDARYQLAVRCPSDYRMMFFAVAGKEQPVADRWIARLIEASKD
jgi:hypothetical protein